MEKKFSGEEEERGGEVELHLKVRVHVNGRVVEGLGTVDRLVTSASSSSMITTTVHMTFY